MNTRIRALSPRSAKGLPQFGFGHNKIVKRGITVSCVTGAVSGSYNHMFRASKDSCVTRLKEGGYKPSEAD